ALALRVVPAVLFPLLLQLPGLLGGGAQVVLFTQLFGLRTVVFQRLAMLRAGLFEPFVQGAQQLAEAAADATGIGKAHRLVLAEFLRCLAADFKQRRPVGLFRMLRLAGKQGVELVAQRGPFRQVGGAFGVLLAEVFAAGFVGG